MKLELKYFILSYLCSEKFEYFIILSEFDSDNLDYFNSVDSTLSKKRRL